MNANHNFFRKSSLSTCLAAVLLLGQGCDDSPAATGDESGQVMLSLAAIPDNVTCIRVTAAGEFRSSVSDFDVVPGDTLAQALTGLPVGAVVFSADAYSVACTSVTKSTIPMWISDIKTVSLVQGKSASVSLTLYKNGRAKVTVEFADQEDGGTGGGIPAGAVDGGSPSGALVTSARISTSI
jgi:hypothetical protein